MYYLLSMLTGFIIAVMIPVNGELAKLHGTHFATAVIHLVGLLLIWVIVAIRKDKVLVKLPFYMYLGGVVGVCTTLFNNLAFGHISVSAILGLALLGQSIASLLIDHFGLFHMPRRVFSKKKLIGLLFVLAGIGAMLQGLKAGALPAVLVSFLSGLSVVVSRSINAALSERTTSYVSTFYNHFVGLIASLPLLFLLGGGEPFTQGFAFSPRLWIYFGGMLGVAVVTLSNITVVKISSFYVTLLTFVGQVFTGILLDVMLSGAFSAQNLAGGLLVAVGLSLNLYFDTNRSNKQSQSCP